MTVSELIAWLQKLPGDAVVYMRYPDGYGIPPVSEITFNSTLNYVYLDT